MMYSLYQFFIKTACIQGIFHEMLSWDILQIRFWNFEDICTKFHRRKLETLSWTISEFLTLLQCDLFFQDLLNFASNSNITTHNDIFINCKIIYKKRNQKYMSVSKIQFSGCSSMKQKCSDKSLYCESRTRNYILCWRFFCKTCNISWIN